MHTSVHIVNRPFTFANMEHYKCFINIVIFINIINCVNEVINSNGVSFCALCIATGHVSFGCPLLPSFVSVVSFLVICRSSLALRMLLLVII